MFSISKNTQSELQAQGYPISPRSPATVILNMIASIALFIIGCVGAAGAFPGPAIGWVAVGVAGGRFILNLTLGNFEKRKFELISEALVAAVILIIGVLGGIGILSVTQAGWGIVGASLVAIPVLCSGSLLKKWDMEKPPHTA